MPDGTHPTPRVSARRLEAKLDSLRAEQREDLGDVRSELQAMRMMVQEALARQAATDVRLSSTEREVRVLSALVRDGDGALLTRAANAENRDLALRSELASVRIGLESHIRSTAEANRDKSAQNWNAFQLAITVFVGLVCALLAVVATYLWH